MSTHTIEAEIEFKFRPAGWLDDGYEVAHPKVEITYKYAPARPAFTPRGEYAPIDPPEGAEVDLVSAKLIDGDGLGFEPAQLNEIASEWLCEDGYEYAVNVAETDRHDMRNVR